MKKPITEINLRGETYPIGLKVVKQGEIGEFLKTNPSRGELFMDENGAMYVIDKGDLDFYWRRLGGEEVSNNASSGFLDDIKLDLF